MNTEHTPAIDLIAAERLRQITVEGWTTEHDAQEHADDNALLRAAECYLSHAIERGWIYRLGDHEDYQGEEQDHWWPDGWTWKPKSPLEDLIRAGALIAAEIDRLQAATGKEAS